MKKMNRLPPTNGTASRPSWTSGPAPVAVVMLSLNESHNMEAVCRNVAGWAQEVFLVDSYSQDDTVDIALAHGVKVVQRKFRGFGDQWNFALRELPITAPWTMKLDPDERLSDQLKENISQAIERGGCDALSMKRRLWFMNRPLPVHQSLVRVWRTGTCRFSNVEVNEHPIVDGRTQRVRGDMEHHDSPDLDHWLEKQNRYTTAEALMAHNKAPPADTPKLVLGTPLQRRMWLKKHFFSLPGRYALLFSYHWIFEGTYRAGRVGYMWARSRADVMRLIEYKRREMEITNRLPAPRHYGPGAPDERVQQWD